ncbi:MAG: hypothetical protein HY000_03210, partial [Planctomycetes bacterium]|nr:hypothetical protein [Planctomycetota bacterium]
MQPLEDRRLLSAVPVGPEFLVNTTTDRGQSAPSAAMAPSGDFVLVWSSATLTNSHIFAQRYNAAGAPQGSEIHVDTTGFGAGSPSVAMDSAGNFFVAWQSRFEGNDWGITARRYDAAGVPQGDDFVVNTFTVGPQQNPSVAMDADGDAVIAWESYGQDGDMFGVFARRINSAGVPLGPEFQVNTVTANEQRRPSVAMGSGGDFIVAWDSKYQDGSFEGIYAQAYSAAGVPQGGEFRVNNATGASQAFPSVDVAADGSFVVAWQHEVVGGWHVNARQYTRTDTDGDGVPEIAPTGNEFQVNTVISSILAHPVLATDAEGNFVVAWTRNQDIYARAYDAAGSALDPEFRVNSFTANDQRDPAVAVDTDGDLVIAWQSQNQDGSQDGIFAQRYLLDTDAPANVQIVDDNDPGFSKIGPWANGLGGRENHHFLATEYQGSPPEIASFWSFDDVLPGRYRVSATWFSFGASASIYTNAAPFTVTDSDVGQVRGTTLINQRQMPNDFTDDGSPWEDLGVFDIVGSSIFVQLDSVPLNPNLQYVVAD